MPGNVEESLMLENPEFFMLGPPYLEKLQFDSKMQLGSVDHVMDHGPKGLVGHKGSDGSALSERLESYGELPGLSGEAIAYGEMSPVEVVMHIAIDDGIKSRCHRSLLFGDKYRMFSCATGAHKLYK